METLAEEAKKPQEAAIRAFAGNRIRYIIEDKVDKGGEQALRQSLRQRICDALSIKNRYTQMLNNTVQPSLEDAKVIAQILEVTVDELCILAPEAK